MGRSPDICHQVLMQNKKIKGESGSLKHTFPAPVAHPVMSTRTSPFLAPFGASGPLGWLCSPWVPGGQADAEEVNVAMGQALSGPWAGLGFQGPQD